MSPKGRQVPPKKLSENRVVVGIVGREDFQRKSGYFSEAPKIHDVFQRISKGVNQKLILLGHLESKRLPLHRYGQRQLLWAVYRLACIFIELMKEVASLVRHPRSISIADARMAWSNIRVSVWRRMLRKARADLVVGIGLTHEEILAARKVGATTIEIQHGIFFEGVEDFYWPKSRPDYFGLWPTTNPELIRGSGIKPINIPFPNISRGAAAMSSDKVLIPLSWGEVWDGREDQFEGAIPPSVAHVLLEGDLEFDRVIFRAHPVFTKRKLRRLRDALARNFSGSELRLPGDEGIESFLSQGSILIAHESATWLEALRLGVPVLTTSTRTARLMSEFHNPIKTPFRLLRPYEKLSDAISSLESCIGQMKPAECASNENEWEGLDRVLLTGF